MTEQEKFETSVEKCMEDHKAVGMAVAIVDAQGVTKYEHFFGKRDRSKDNGRGNGENRAGFCDRHMPVIVFKKSVVLQIIEINQFY